MKYCEKCAYKFEEKLFKTFKKNLSKQLFLGSKFLDKNDSKSNSINPNFQELGKFECDSSFIEYPITINILNSNGNRNQFNLQSEDQYLTLNVNSVTVNDKDTFNLITDVSLIAHPSLFFLVFLPENIKRKATLLTQVCYGDNKEIKILVKAKEPFEPIELINEKIKLLVIKKMNIVWKNSSNLIENEKI